MLKRKYRLPASAKLINPKSHLTVKFVLKIAKNNLSYNRFGFIVSKKVAKNAVDRNRSKRLLRSCVEDIFTQINPGYDYLFIIRKNLAGIRKENICEQVNKVLTQTYLIKK